MRRLRLRELMNGVFGQEPPQRDTLSICQWADVRPSTNTGR